MHDTLTLIAIVAVSGGTAIFFVALLPIFQPNYRPRRRFRRALRKIPFQGVAGCVRRGTMTGKR